MDGFSGWSFQTYIGIDYSGAETPTSPLKGLRAYCASPCSAPVEVHPAGAAKHWTRRGLAEWLLDRLREARPTLVGIDHAFSFPLAYFERYDLPHDWTGFLDDFQAHWPTDGDSVYVDFVREGECGSGKERMGNSHWRRLTDIRSSSKSVFHFDVPGSVAKSTHAGLPWLRYIRRHAGSLVHFWPFDGWDVLVGRSVIVEVYPRLWSHSFPREERTGDQHDAYGVAAWMCDADASGRLKEFLVPDLTDSDRAKAGIEGWILGIK